jgi:hypothetical protein
MLNIVGGTYQELCREPEWQRLFGSGFRAAAAISELSKGVRFHTYVGEQDRKLLRLTARAFGVDLATCTLTTETIQFAYHHPLTAPRIWPQPHLIRQNPPLELKDDHVLRYGMLEGDAVVHGKRVVYDPQSPSNPKRFEDNGSTAESLAVVANMSEWRGLTGLSDVNEICERLRKEAENRVFVIKMGSGGALIVTSSAVEGVPAFQTDRVFSIGSGDVFAAVFAHCWCEENRTPRESALLASRATAYYCCTSVLPIPEDPSVISGAIRGETPASLVGKPPTGSQVYLAGPFFNAAQRWLVDQMRTGLTDQGLRVFSPLHDVGRGGAEEVAGKDLAGLNGSAVVLALIDGLDAGTIFEVGYARAKGIPVVALAQDVKPEDVKMLCGTDCIICDDMTTAVYRTAWVSMTR